MMVALISSCCSLVSFFWICVSWLVRKASSVRRFSFSSISGLLLMDLMSSFRPRILVLVLCFSFFVSFLAIILMLALKSFHRICRFSCLCCMGMFMMASILVWVCMPFLMILSIRASLLIVFSGQVHLPFPMIGVSLGANFTETIQWSVGIGDGPAFHSNRLHAW